MNEIGRTFKWSDKAKAYAAAFREGDAVKVGGEWYEVRRYEGVGILLEPYAVHAISNTSAAASKDNPYNLNHGYKESFAGIASGFLGSRVMTPYQITTLKDYEVQKGDKLIWLGEGYGHWVFGRSYAVEVGSCGRLVAFDENGLERLPKSENWAVIPRYENAKEEEEMDGKGERSGNVGKFKKGDRVKVTGGSYKGSEGSVGQSDEVGDGLSYAVLFDDGRDRWFEGEFLELVEGVEKSPEQEAFDYLLSQDTSSTRRILKDEVAIWAKVHLEHKDYVDLRQAIEILEKLEESEQD